MWKTNPKKYETICVDFDKTLCVNDQFGLPNHKISNLIRELNLGGYFIIVYTSRKQSYRIQNWLENYDIPYDLIVCNKPEAVAYIDDRALPPQTLFLKSIILSMSKKLKALMTCTK